MREAVWSLEYLGDLETLLGIWCRRRGGSARGWTGDILTDDQDYKLRGLTDYGQTRVLH